MKKKYIIPRIEISICVLENFIAASPTGSGNVTVDDKTTDLKKTDEDVDLHAKQFDAWGVKEVLMTLGSYGSVIFVEGKFYEIPAYKPRKVEDATGCGDTYAAGYLYSRAKGAGYVEAGKYAAAMCTLKIEHTGPFDRSEDEVFKVMGTR